MRLSLTALTRGIGSLDGSIDVELEKTSRDHFSKFISVARAKRLINPRYCLSSLYLGEKGKSASHNCLGETSRCRGRGKGGRRRQRKKKGRRREMHLSYCWGEKRAGEEAPCRQKSWQMLWKLDGLTVIIEHR